eukprot:4049174-Pyramimonas_sp.AAC.1
MVTGLIRNQRCPKAPKELTASSSSALGHPSVAILAQICFTPASSRTDTIMGDPWDDAAAEMEAGTTSGDHDGAWDRHFGESPHHDFSRHADAPATPDAAQGGDSSQQQPQHPHAHEGQPRKRQRMCS